MALGSRTAILQVNPPRAVCVEKLIDEGGIRPYNATAGFPCPAAALIDF